MQYKSSQALSSKASRVAKESNSTGGVPLEAVFDFNAYVDGDWTYSWKAVCLQDRRSKEVSRDGNTVIVLKVAWRVGKKIVFLPSKNLA
jgi:hypothetical protein